jgi:anion-transporting  ArsA/GET3 family ATPase
LAEPKKSLHFVLGKGGVGKSTVAAALCLDAKLRGARVLGIELDAPGGLSRAFGVTLEHPGRIVQSPAGVTLTYFDGAAALDEYLTRRVRLGPLLEKVLAHPLYRAFVAAAPGVKELMAMGKIRDELVLQKFDHRPRWDVVVVDAGASGHALEYLGMPQAAAATFRAGRVHRESRRVQGVLADPTLTAVHVVATAESMPVQEAIASVTRLRDDLGLPLGRLIVNKTLVPPPVGVAAALETLAALPLSDAHEAEVASGIFLAVRRGIGWARLQERYVAELEAATGLAALRLPRLAADPFSLDEIARLAGRLAELA